MTSSFFADVPVSPEDAQTIEQVLADLEALEQRVIASEAAVDEDLLAVQQLKADVEVLIATIPEAGTSVWKTPVRLATAANIDTQSPPGSFDGTSASLEDRLLLTNQSNRAENGLWVYNGASVPLTRPDDADEAAKRGPGIFVFSTGGTSNADSLWFATGSTDNLTFTKFTAAGSGAPVREAEIAGFLQGTLATGVTVFAYAPTQDITIPADFSGSTARASSAPTGLIGLAVSIGGTQIGDLVIESSGSARFSASDPSSPIPVSAGSVISFTSPDPVRDAGNISFSILASLD